MVNGFFLTEKIGTFNLVKCYFIQIPGRLDVVIYGICL